MLVNVMTDPNYLFLKEVDKSVLYDGLTLPKNDVKSVFSAMGRTLEHGESITIVVEIDGETFDVTLDNINFSRKKYAKHADLLQIRYSRNAPLAVKLREKFSSTVAIVDRFYGEKEKGDRSVCKIPDELKEWIEVFYSAGRFVFVCRTQDDLRREPDVGDEPESTPNARRSFAERVAFAFARRLRRRAAIWRRLVVGTPVGV